MNPSLQLLRGYRARAEKGVAEFAIALWEKRAWGRA